MTRFELLVIARIQVKDRAVLRRYFAVEAVMEALAPAAGLDPTHAALTGLGASLDVRLCAHNPDRRGEVAREMLLTEGAPLEVQEAVGVAYRGQPDELPPMAAALVAAEALVDAAFAALEDLAFDELTAHHVAIGVRRHDRALAALAALGIDLDDAAAATVRGLHAARADLT